MIPAKNAIKPFLTLFLILFLLSNSNGQDSTLMKQINNQVWLNFEKAFLTNDVELLKSIHIQNVLRIPADKKVIVPGKEYFESQDKSFKWIRENDYQTKIELRFTERICNSGYASERGIFRFTVTDDEQNERVFYGKFHVLLEKKDDKWKIFVDYDSDEQGTITKESYNNAYEKWDFKPFLR